MPPITLETGRLWLRPWRAEDLAPLHAINGDAGTMRHFPSVMTRAESDDWAARLQAHIDRHGWGFWAVEEKGGAPLIGAVGLMNIPWQAHFTPAVEVGWRIGPGHRRRGFAGEAARAALEFGFRELGLDRILAFTVPANEPSWRLMEQLSMRRDGVFAHPRLPPGHRLSEHVLYRLDARDVTWHMDGGRSATMLR